MLKILAIALTIVSYPAYGSSGDAWAAFRTEVEHACVAAAGETLRDTFAIVDPFGSESYGLAIIRGQSMGDDTIYMICVLDKRTRQVELSGELDLLNQGRP